MRRGDGRCVLLLTALLALSHIASAGRLEFSNFDACVVTDLPFYHNDIYGVGEAYEPASCCALCHSDSRCVSFVYEPAAAACWLYEFALDTTTWDETMPCENCVAGVPVMTLPSANATFTTEENTALTAEIESASENKTMPTAPNYLGGPGRDFMMRFHLDSASLVRVHTSLGVAPPPATSTDTTNYTIVTDTFVALLAVEGGEEAGELVEVASNDDYGWSTNPTSSMVEIVLDAGYYVLLVEAANGEPDGRFTAQIQRPLTAQYALPTWTFVPCWTQSTTPQNFQQEMTAANVVANNTVTHSGLQVTVAGFFQFSSNFDTKFRVSTCRAPILTFESVMRIFDERPLVTPGVALNIGDERAVNVDWRDALNDSSTAADTDPVLEYSLCDPDAPDTGRDTYLEFTVPAFGSVDMVITGQDGLVGTGSFDLNYWCSDVTPATPLPTLPPSTTVPPPPQPVEWLGNPHVPADHLRMFSTLDLRLAHGFSFRLRGDTDIYITHAGFYNAQPPDKQCEYLRIEVWKAVSGEKLNELEHLTLSEGVGVLSWGEIGRLRIPYADGQKYIFAIYDDTDSECQANTMFKNSENFDDYNAVAGSMWDPSDSAVEVLRSGRCVLDEGGHCKEIDNSLTNTFLLFAYELVPTPSPTPLPTSLPTLMPTPSPTLLPTLTPTPSPTASPTLLPTPHPTPSPTASPTSLPTPTPTLPPALQAAQWAGNAMLTESDLSALDTRHLGADSYIGVSFELEDTATPIAITHVGVYAAALCSNTSMTRLQIDFWNPTLGEPAGASFFLAIEHPGELAVAELSEPIYVDSPDTTYAITMTYPTDDGVCEEEIIYDAGSREAFSLTGGGGSMWPVDGSMISMARAGRCVSGYNDNDIAKDCLTFEPFADDTGNPLLMFGYDDTLQPTPSPTPAPTAPSDTENPETQPFEWVGNPDLTAAEIATLSPRSLGTLLGFEFSLKEPGDMLITHFGIYGADASCRSVRFDIWDMTDNVRIGFPIAFTNDGPGVFTSWELPVPFRLNYRDEHSTYVMNAYAANCQRFPLYESADPAFDSRNGSRWDANDPKVQIHGSGYCVGYESHDCVSFHKREAPYNMFMLFGFEPISSPAKWVGNPYLSLESFDSGIIDQRPLDDYQGITFNLRVAGTIAITHVGVYRARAVNACGTVQFDLFNTETGRIADNAGFLNLTTGDNMAELVSMSLPEPAVLTSAGHVDFNTTYVLIISKGSDEAECQLPYSNRSELDAATGSEWAPADQAVDILKTSSCTWRAWNALRGCDEQDGFANRFIMLGYETVKPNQWLGNTAIAAADVATFTRYDDRFVPAGFAFQLRSPREYVDVTHVAMYAPPPLEDVDSLCTYRFRVWDVARNTVLNGGEATLSGATDLGGVLSVELDVPIRVEASSVDDLFLFTVITSDCTSGALYVTSNADFDVSSNADGGLKWWRSAYAKDESAIRVVNAIECDIGCVEWHTSTDIVNNFIFFGFETGVLPTPSPTLPPTFPTTSPPTPAPATSRSVSPTTVPLAPMPVPTPSPTTGRGEGVAADSTDNTMVAIIASASAASSIGAVACFLMCVYVWWRRNVRDKFELSPAKRLRDSSPTAGGDNDNIEILTMEGGRKARTKRSPYSEESSTSSASGSISSTESVSSRENSQSLTPTTRRRHSDSNRESNRGGSVSTRRTSHRKSSQDGRADGRTYFRRKHRSRLRGGPHTSSRSKSKRSVHSGGGGKSSPARMASTMQLRKKHAAATGSVGAEKRPREPRGIMATDLTVSDLSDWSLAPPSYRDGPADGMGSDSADSSDSDMDTDYSTAEEADKEPAAASALAAAAAGYFELTSSNWVEEEEDDKDEDEDDGCSDSVGERGVSFSGSSSEFGDGWNSSSTGGVSEPEVIFDSHLKAGVGSSSGPKRRKPAAPSKPKPTGRSVGAPPKTVECTECGEKIVGVDNIAKHMREAHNKQFGFPCGICGKLMRRKFNLSVHILTHTAASEAKPKHVCEYCGKPFLQKSNLTRHVVTTHLKPVKCPKCTGRFYSKEEAMRHAEKAHPEVASKLRFRIRKVKPKKNDYRCECSMPFNSIGELKKHQKSCDRVPKDYADTIRKAAAAHPEGSPVTLPLSQDRVVLPMAPAAVAAVATAAAAVTKPTDRGSGENNGSGSGGGNSPPPFRSSPPPERSGSGLPPPPPQASDSDSGSDDGPRKGTVKMEDELESGALDASATRLPKVESSPSELETVDERSISEIAKTEADTNHLPSAASTMPPGTEGSTSGHAFTSSSALKSDRPEKPPNRFNGESVSSMTTSTANTSMDYINEASAANSPSMSHVPHRNVDPLSSPDNVISSSPGARLPLLYHRASTSSALEGSMKAEYAVSQPHLASVAPGSSSSAIGVSSSNAIRSLVTDEGQRPSGLPPVPPPTFLLTPKYAPTSVDAFRHMHDDHSPGASNRSMKSSSSLPSSTSRSSPRSPREALQATTTHEHRSPQLGVQSYRHQHSLDADTLQRQHLYAQSSLNLSPQPHLAPHVPLHHLHHEPSSSLLPQQPTNRGEPDHATSSQHADRRQSMSAALAASMAAIDIGGASNTASASPPHVIDLSEEEVPSRTEGSTIGFYPAAASGGVTGHGGGVSVGLPPLSPGEAQTFNHAAFATMQAQHGPSGAETMSYSPMAPPRYVDPREELSLAQGPGEAQVLPRPDSNVYTHETSAELAEGKVNVMAESASAKREADATDEDLEEYRAFKREFRQLMAMKGSMEGGEPGADGNNELPPRFYAILKELAVKELTETDHVSQSPVAQPAPGQHASPLAHPHFDPKSEQLPAHLLNSRQADLSREVPFVPGSRVLSTDEVLAQHEVMHHAHVSTSYQPQTPAFSTSGMNFSYAPTTAAAVKSDLSSPPLRSSLVAQNFPGMEHPPIASHQSVALPSLQSVALTSHQSVALTSHQSVALPPHQSVALPPHQLLQHTSSHLQQASSGGGLLLTHHDAAPAASASSLDASAAALQSGSFANNAADALASADINSGSSPLVDEGLRIGKLPESSKSLWQDAFGDPLMRL